MHSSIFRRQISWFITFINKLVKICSRSVYFTYFNMNLCRLSLILKNFSNPFYQWIFHWRTILPAKQIKLLESLREVELLIKLKSKNYVFLDIYKASAIRYCSGILLYTVHFAAIKSFLKKKFAKKYFHIINRAAAPFNERLIYILSIEDTVTHSNMLFLVYTLFL